MIPLIPSEFIALDIETTGLSSRNDDIIEIAAVLFKQGEPVDRFSTLVKTDKTLSLFIISLTGITQEALLDGVTIKEALSRFLDFAGSRPLVAHNLSFDVGFIQNKLKAVKLRALANPCFDTLLFSRLALPGEVSYKLENLSRRFNLSDGRAHRALTDAEACGKLFGVTLTALSAFPEEKRSLLGRLVRFQDTDTGRLLQTLVKDAPVEPVIRKKRAHLPEPLSPLEKRVDITAAPLDGFFQPGGVLAEKLEAYEYRGGQLKMAQAVRRALNQQGFLCVEAGTGTGKSLAYLTAAVLYAAANGVRVIISTKTRSLQDQIFKKEIPFLKEHLGVDFSATVLKGRTNYLCRRKWNEMVSAPSLFLRGWEADELLPLTLWVEESLSGDIAECMSFNEKENRILWARLSADAETCLGSRCLHFGDCFVMRKRREAAASHIVLVNHSLFFTDLKTDGYVLGRYGAIVFDEAHTLEETGRKHLGQESGHLLFSTALQKLYKADEGGHGLLRYLQTALSKAGSEARNFMVAVEGRAREVAEAESASVRFFRSLGSELKKRREEKLRYSGPLLDILDLKSDPFDLKGFVARLYTLLTEIQTAFPEDEPLQHAAFDALCAGRELEGLDAVRIRLLNGEGKGEVFWAEKNMNPLNVKLFSAPLEIANSMTVFLSGMESAVFTSATLAVNQDLGYFTGRLGFTGELTARLEKEIIGSHFNYEQQLHFSILRNMPLPDDPTFIAETAQILLSLSKRYHRRTLALFTSRDMLRRVYQEAVSGYETENIPLLAQDISGNGYHLVEEMKRRSGSVLLGTSTFWEGVDLPGDHLELLVIVRLPFAVPTDPIIAARGETCEREGKSAFGQFYLPEAVIKFRQGVGRLIRRKDDRGVVLVLDTRLVEKPYGRLFTRSVEGEPKIADSAEGLFQAIDAFFAKG